MDDKQYKPISPIAWQFLEALDVHNYFRGRPFTEAGWAEAIERIEEECVSSFFFLSAIKYLCFCRDNELTILDLQEAKWHLQYWLSSSVPKNPRVRRRAEETVIAIEQKITELCSNK
jgi:hypothetical protein